MEQPLISIIIPVYNVEKYLEECIKSVLNQTYSKIEVLLIDDGSTDNSSNICMEAVEKDQRVKYFYKENGGQSEARNYGIEVSNGDYLIFLDSDDWIEENAVECLVQTQKYYQTKIVVANFNFYMEESATFYFQVYGNVYFEKVYRRESLINHLPELRGCFPNGLGILIARELFQNVRFPVGRWCEDLGTSYKLYFQCESVVYINRSLYWYRVRPNSTMSHQHTKKFMMDEFELNMERLATVALLGGDSTAYKKLILERIENAWLPNCVGELEKSSFYYSLLAIRQLLME